MFKSVEYVGFEGRADLRRVAEELTPVLGEEVSELGESVSVRWVNGHNPLAPLVLELTLVMPAAEASTSYSFLSDDLYHPDRARLKCRQVWLGLLRRYSEERLAVIRDSWKQPVGV